jgi:hypothetical protein
MFKTTNSSDICEFISLSNSFIPLYVNVIILLKNQSITSNQFYFLYD